MKFNKKIASTLAVAVIAGSTLAGCSGNAADNGNTRNFNRASSTRSHGVADAARRNFTRNIAADGGNYARNGEIRRNTGNNGITRSNYDGTFDGVTRKATSARQTSRVNSAGNNGVKSARRATTFGTTSGTGNTFGANRSLGQTTSGTTSRIDNGAYRAYHRDGIVNDGHISGVTRGFTDGAYTTARDGLNRTAVKSHADENKDGQVVKTVKHEETKKDGVKKDGVKKATKKNTAKKATVAKKSAPVKKTDGTAKKTANVKKTAVKTTKAPVTAKAHATAKTDAAKVTRKAATVKNTTTNTTAQSPIISDINARGNAATVKDAASAYPTLNDRARLTRRATTTPVNNGVSDRSLGKRGTMYVTQISNQNPRNSAADWNKWYSDMAVANGYAPGPNGMFNGARQSSGVTRSMTAQNATTAPTATPATRSDSFNGADFNTTNNQNSTLNNNESYNGFNGYKGYTGYNSGFNGNNGFSGYNGYVPTHLRDGFYHSNRYGAGQGYDYVNRANGASRNSYNGYTGTNGYNYGMSRFNGFNGTSGYNQGATSGNGVGNAMYQGVVR